MALNAGNYSSICNTTACHNLSAYVLKSLSPEFENINACTNWDKLVCDGYRKNNVIPTSRSELSAITSLNLEVNKVLQNVLYHSYYELDEKIYAGSPWLIDIDHVDDKTADIHNFNKAKSFYTSCMYDYNAQKEGYDPLKKLFGQIFGEVHHGKSKAASQQTYDTHNMTQALIQMNNRGLDSFVEFGPAKSLLDPSQMVVIVRPQLGLGLERHEYQNKNLVQRYTSLVQMVFEETENHLWNNSRQLAEVVVKLESEIAKLLPSPERQRDLQAKGTVIQVPAHTLKDYIGYVPMTEIIQAQPLPEGYQLKTVEMVFPEVVKKLNKLWLSTTVIERVAYMRWQVFLETENLWQMPWLSDWKQFIRILEERESDRDGRDLCISRTKRQLPHIMDSIFIKTNFSVAARDRAIEIFSNIKKEYIDLLNSTAWLSPITRSSVLNKAKDIKANIGYNDVNPDISNSTRLFEYYHGSDIHTIVNETSESSRHIDQHFNLENWHQIKAWSDLSKPPKPHPWTMDATTANAAYSPQDNGVILPAGILQFPFFGSDTPLLASYAAYGAIAAHELTHAFDDQSRNFGADGRLGNHGWTEEDIKQYDYKASCFSKAYDRLASKHTDANTPPMPSAQGGLVLGESIADAYGAEVAFRAWKAAPRQGLGQMLPGLESFTEDQLFWVIRSMPFCSLEKQSFLEQQALTDVHPAMQLRTWMPLMNSRHWHESFGCAVEEPTCELFGDQQ